MELCRHFWFGFLLCIAGAGWWGAGSKAAPAELVRTSGDEVTFALEIPAGEMLDNVGWTIGTKSLAIVEAGAPPRVVVSQRRYRGRLRVPTDGLSLLIAALSPEDAGSYTAIIHTDKSQFTRIFTLRVYERLPQPRIRCDAQSCANGLCNTTLSCTIPSGGSNVTYSWSPPQPSSTTPQGSTAVIPHPDPLINVTCTAHNPVSNNSTTASVKALCAESSSSIAGTAWFSIFPIAAVILVIGGLIWYRRKKKAECLTLEAGNEKEEERQNSTLYAQVGFQPSAPKKPERSPGNGAVHENPKTIYATVQPQSQAAMQTDDEKMCKETTMSPHQNQKHVDSAKEMPPGTQTLPML
ncbi:PREDICTED: T-lymphocyte surface antigen Ly-9-like isoform X2 [Crocodylus porosus]|uniref:T-lymphocyte surface antigen Ly-9-like isoform X2 n=1 Tax=Crocodylus porosus TaxID=8502 RepID=UPI00093F9CBD|nr:PREDICTED: T-lymphocyte surface antigen Ly-9-like isoform X2 [Crocodylus porosus]